VLAVLGELFDRLSVDVEDASTAFAQSVRLMLRLCRSRPQISAVLVREGMHYMECEGGVAPRLLRDIRAGVASGLSGRFSSRACQESTASSHQFTT
jgi:hypothetical protein